jgi:ATP-dependent helicase/nuclease subunit A
LDKAANFQSGRVAGLRGFLAFLDKIKERGGVTQISPVTEGEDVVRIMSIHGSKGLEFPIVLLGGLGRGLSQHGLEDPTLLLHKGTGLSLQWVDPKIYAYKDTLLHSAVRLQRQIDERAEIIRLLYVAMTRAMDTLHMIGTLSKVEEWRESYGGGNGDPAVDTDIFGASSYLKLILPTVAAHEELFKVAAYAPEEINGALDFGAPRPGTSLR